MTNQPPAVPAGYRDWRWECAGARWHLYGHAGARWHLYGHARLTPLRTPRLAWLAMRNGEWDVNLENRKLSPLDFAALSRLITQKLAELGEAGRET